MALDLVEKIYVEARLANDGPSMALTYFFWLFLGIISAHRFYLGRTGSAIAQIISYFFVVGVIWWAVDLFLTFGMVREKQAEMRRRIAAELEMPAGTISR